MMKQSENAQALLWYLPNALGHGWWYICAVIAGCAAVTMFLYMIMNEKFSGLLMSRTIMCGGLLCFALVPLNSGWLPWGVLLISIGALHASFLIATDWCNRQDKWQRVREILTGRRKAQDAHQHRRFGSD